MRWGGGHLGENGQNYQISVFCSKSVFRYGGITSQIFRGLAALEPRQNGGQRGGHFFSFSIENEKEMERIFCTFCRKSSKDSKTVFFFHSSIKTEEVLFVYIYIYIYIYIYLFIYKKLSPKWKKTKSVSFSILHIV